MIEHTAFSPDEVMTILDTSTGRGYTQMQIMPAHALARRGEFCFWIGLVLVWETPSQISAPLLYLFGYLAVEICKAKSARLPSDATKVWRGRHG